MILDKQNLMSENQAVTATAVSSNIIDLGAEHAYVPHINEEGLIEVLSQVTEDFAGLTDLKVTLETSVDEAFTSPIEVVSSGAVAVADLKAGKKFPVIALPEDLKQYIRIKYTVNGVGTAGKITSGLVVNRQTNR